MKDDSPFCFSTMRAGPPSRFVHHQPHDHTNISGSLSTAQAAAVPSHVLATVEVQITPRNDARKLMPGPPRPNPRCPISTNLPIDARIASSYGLENRKTNLSAFCLFLSNSFGKHSLVESVVVLLGDWCFRRRWTFAWSAMAFEDSDVRVPATMTQCFAYCDKLHSNQSRAVLQMVQDAS
jgi:hypothetical protein